MAEVEAQTQGAESALALIDEGLARADSNGEHLWDPYLYRVRANILLKRDPADSALAEEAYQTAIAIAQQQGARSFGLRAALALAKLYQSTGRPADAHAILAPALEGFAPTREMPEIAEVQALLAAVAETDEVKAAIARRQQLGQLRVAYGNALFNARGPGAPETTEAFKRVHDPTNGHKAGTDRLAADYGLWVGSHIRGELPLARAYAAAFLSDVAGTPDSPEAGVAYRAAGFTHWFAGEYNEAREHLERALALFQPGRDDDLAFRFGQDAGVAAMVLLALTLWPRGDVERAAYLVGRARGRIAGTSHISTQAHGNLHAVLFELIRGDRSRVASNASEFARAVREHDLHLLRVFGVFFEGWAKLESGAPSDGLEAMRCGVELLRGQKSVVFDGLLKIALAEAEALAGDLDRALAALDEGLATSERTGHRTFDAELHRVRGKILLKREPAEAASAEQAFQTAFAVSRQQGTRAFELRAALALAMLYQSTGRFADAHAVLAPALEGFSPTPEMPEIAEAQALMERLE